MRRRSSWGSPIRAIDLQGTSISRLEERQGWLGHERQDPAECDAAWFQRDEPRDEEEER